MMPKQRNININQAVNGGAIQVRWPDGTPQAVDIINNIFHGNLAYQGNSVACKESGIASISYCDAWPNNGELYHYYDDGNPPSYTPPGLNAGTCMYSNPLFYLSGDNPYWLNSNPLSPVRGAGLNPAPGNSVPNVDKDGRPRPGTNNTTDMGAYEDNPSQ